MPESSLPKSIFSQPVHRLLVLSFIIISLVPVGLLGFKLYQEAWDNAWREIHEKHRLLALNMASPIQIYISDHQNLLALLAEQLHNIPDTLATKAMPAVKARLESAIHHMDGLRSLSLVDADGMMHVNIQRVDRNNGNANTVFADEKCFLKSRDTGNPSISNVKPSPLTGQPTIILSHPVGDGSSGQYPVLVAELKIELIEGLRTKIHFGEKGHSAIVDSTGHVIAHPNPEWMKEIYDLSGLSIVKRMMNGETGVMEFYSPFVKQQMVAGYTSVEGLGWGIMVPQPKIEVENQVNNLILSQFSWAIFGLLLALAFAIPLAIWITRPINRLARAASTLVKSDFKGDIPPLSKNAPKEIAQLDAGLRTVISGLQHSRDEVDNLNQSLQLKIEEATQQLRNANSRLENLAKSDYLTDLSNRRHFEKTLNKLLRNRVEYSDPICIMLIDVDNFKDINDKYGHAAGDAVLVQIAPILKMNMRPNDLVARYGGDEFVIQMNCSTEVGISRAREIRAYLQAYDFEWQGHKINTTVSIGLLHPDGKSDPGKIQELDIESLLQKADTAMYDAKRRGRNTVVQIAY